MESSLSWIMARGSPFELEETCVNGVQCRAFSKGPKTLRDIFLKAASFRDRIMVVCGDTQLSYRDVHVRADRVAAAMRRSFSIRNGSRVAIVMENRPEWILALVAITSIGATAVLIDPNARPHDILSMCSLTACSLIVTEQCRVDQLRSREQPFQIVVVHTGNNEANTVAADNAEFVDVANSADPPVSIWSEVCNIGPDDEALIAFTSGTSGAPKGVILTQRNLITGVMNMMLGGALNSARASLSKEGNGRRQRGGEPCTLVLSPLFHIGGYAQILLAFYVAGKIVLLRRWEPKEVLRLVEDMRVRSINGASPVMLRELTRFRPRGVDTTSLSVIVIGGLVLNATLRSAIATAFPGVSLGVGYGMTETCGSICTASQRDTIERPEASGLLLPSVDVQIMKANGEVAAAGESGEIFIRGAMVMRGYCANDAVATPVSHEGWLRTGDRGKVDTDGYLYIIDRQTEVFSVAGKQLIYSEIERDLCSHLPIDEAAACAIPHTTRGERLVLAIVPSPDSPLDVPSLIQHALAVPSVADIHPLVVVLNALPRTASGKVNSNALKAEMIEWGSNS